MAERVFRGIVHCRIEGVLWGSRGRVIYRSGDEGRRWERVAEIPVAGVRSLAGVTRLSRRLLRMMVYHLEVLEQRYLVVLAFGRTFTLDLEQGAKLVGSAVLRGKRPLSFCRSRDGRLIYGEYRGNPERTPVSIWSSEDRGLTWHAAHTFTEVRHVHGVYEDPYDEGFWITTGDEDHESAIWKASSDFERLERVVAGDQQARVIAMEFTPEAIIYGTDTPLEGNRIYEFRRHAASPRALGNVTGSVFHSCRCGDETFFTTACEPSAANPAREALLYRVRPDGSCDGIRAWRKDPWPMKLFQYGQVFLVGSDRREDGIWATPFATHGDQMSRRLVMSED